MDMQDTVILEWTYTPSNYFEEPISIQRDDCLILMGDGRVTATVLTKEYDQEHHKRNQLHEYVESHFKAVLLTTYRYYELSKPSMPMVYSDGRQDVTLSLDCISATAIISDHVDLISTNSEGKILLDTKRERIDSQQALAELIAQIAPADPLVKKILSSFATAIEDPKNELVHLYEIRDALSKHFGGDKVARHELGISKHEWSRLGHLACGEPVRQGRHRGEHLGPLRVASDDELHEARRLARHFIEAYLKKGQLI